MTYPYPTVAEWNANGRQLKPSDAVLITAFGRNRGGFVLAVSPTGLRARVRYVTHSQNRGKLGERWESVDRLAKAWGGRDGTCAHCDNLPDRVTERRREGNLPGTDPTQLLLVCERHARPDSPMVPVERPDLKGPPQQ